MLNNLEFKNPLDIIYALLPIVCLVTLILSYRKKEKIMNALKISARARFKTTRLILTVLGLSFMFFALLGPQIFKGFTEVKSRGLDIYVLMDTSKSMLVRDVEPDRISRAKKIVGSILDNLDGDRIGFIPFSSGAYIQMPLTDDYQVVRMFLDVMDTDMISGGGTNIGAAIKLAHKSFDRTSSADRVVIILSDGEEHQTNSLDVLKEINDEQLKVFTVGIGTTKGELIPVFDSASRRITDYKKDAGGNFITSSLKPDSLKKLAASGRGVYYQSSVSGKEIASLIKDISSLKRDALNTKKIRKFSQLYQYFLGVGILLFLAAYLLPERRRAE